MKNLTNVILMAIMISLVTIVMNGCRNETGKITDNGTNGEETARSTEEKSIGIIFGRIYDEAVKTNELDSMEMMKHMIAGLGENGYAAVDSQNQIDMVCPEQIRQFCEQVEAKEEGEATLIVIQSSAGFIKYEFTTSGGVVEVLHEYYLYKGNDTEKVSSKRYQAYTWVYSGDGYLFFEEYQMPGYDGPSGHTAVRIEPLDEKCRELNRKYILPVGYEQNNLFTADWSENDFKELNFYDLYEDLRRMKSDGYAGTEFSHEEETYEIPKQEFENIFQAYFEIDSETLQQYTVYYEDAEMYQYKPRGMFDIAATPYVPYPEVTAFKENPGGTMTLTVNAVWPERSLAKAFCHEVTIRPLENEGFQYVSNHVIPSDNNVEITWYTERLGSADLLTSREEQDLQNQALAAAERCAEFYRNSRIACAGTDYAYVEDFSDENRKNAVKCLGGQGLVSLSDDMNMENHEKVEEFYSDHLSGSDSRITVYNVYKDGGIVAMTFISRSGKIQYYYVMVGWQEGGIPEIREFGIKDLEEIKLTEKGYFIYTFADTIMHGNLREYFRVSPLSSECREMTEKYVKGLSYVDYNMLVTNWDAGNAKEILTPCMFEDIYRICTGRDIVPEQGRIPAELYEKVMTTCFPVTEEQVKEYCGYQKETDSYEYEMIFPRQFPPYGEVVDFVKNEDGTVTLIVDCVWIDCDTDCAYTNRIVVQPFADGKFRYLSNSIKERELLIL